MLPHTPLSSSRRRRRAAVSVVALASLALGACGDDDDSDVSATEPATEASSVPSVTTPSTPEVAGSTLTATLSGAEEVPGPGVKDGTGTVQLEVKGDEVCYDLKATMGEQPTAAHVHQAASGASGPVFLDLKPTFAAGESAFLAAACTPAAGQADKLAADPAGFYVNIHTAEHPDGALRGQLAKSAY